MGGATWLFKVIAVNMFIWDEVFELDASEMDARAIKSLMSGIYIKKSLSLLLGTHTTQVLVKYYFCISAFKN